MGKHCEVCQPTNRIRKAKMVNDVEVLLEKQRIRVVVEIWVVWRDSGQW